MTLLNSVVTFLKKISQPCEYRTIDNVEDDQFLSKYDKIFISFFVFSGNVLTNSLIETYHFSKYVYDELGTYYYINFNSNISEVSINENVEEEDKEDKEEDTLNKRCTIEKNEDGEWNETIVQKNELEQMMDEDVKKKIKIFLKFFKKNIYIV